MTAARGLFVVLEGADGSGKSTQAALLAERLKAEGRDAVLTFEPGATPLGRRIRSLLLDDADAVEPIAEALLMSADRAQHVAEVIVPALARGAVVVSDRYIPSSLAYQGAARGLGVEVIQSLNEWASGGLVPDVVIVLDVTETVAASRRTGTPDRLEREQSTFHEQVRRTYRELAQTNNWLLVDAAADRHMIADRIWEEVRRIVR